MGLLWDFYKVSLRLLYAVYGFSAGFLWDFYDSSMIFIWDFCGVAMGFLRDVYGWDDFKKSSLQCGTVYLHKFGCNLCHFGFAQI